MLAASVLTKAAHRSIVARRLGRITAGRSDADQRIEATRNDGSESPMLRLRAAANNARDARLAAIDLANHQSVAIRPTCSTRDIRSR